MNPAILAVPGGEWLLLSKAIFWGESLKETIQGFSSAVFHPWEELCASGFQLEQVPGGAVGQTNLTLSCSGGQPVLPPLLPASKDSQNVGTVFWIPKTGVLFPPTSGSSWLCRWPWDEWTSHPACAAAGKPHPENAFRFHIYVWASCLCLSCQTSFRWEDQIPLQSKVRQLQWQNFQLRHWLLATCPQEVHRHRGEEPRLLADIGNSISLNG